MFIIGIDPHEGSHTAAVIDRDEQVVGELSVQADRRQRDRLLAWAALFEPRLWAVEGATGHGALLAQQLVASGETVVDVPFVRHSGEPLGLQLEYFLDLVEGKRDADAERSGIFAPHDVAARVERP